MARFPEGLIMTKFTFQVLRTIRDDTGDTTDEIVEIHDLGGVIGDKKQWSPESANIDIGDRWSFASNWNPGAPYPINIVHAYIQPSTTLPDESELKAEWEAHCGL